MDVLMDYIEKLDWIAVFLAAAAAYATSGFWYSPNALGKQWAKAAGLNAKRKKPPKDTMTVIMVLSALMVVITSISLAVLVDVLHIKGLADGAILGVLVGTGFVITNNGMHKLFEQRPPMHFAIQAVGDVVALAVMGGVLGIFN